MSLDNHKASFGSVGTNKKIKITWMASLSFSLSHFTCVFDKRSKQNQNWVSDFRLQEQTVFYNFFFVFTGNFWGAWATCVRVHTVGETNICCSDYIENAALLNTKTTKNYTGKKKQHRLFYWRSFYAKSTAGKKKTVEWKRAEKMFSYVNKFCFTKNETKRELLMCLYLFRSLS